MPPGRTGPACRPTHVAVHPASADRPGGGRAVRSARPDAVDPAAPAPPGAAPGPVGRWCAAVRRCAGAVGAASLAAWRSGPGAGLPLPDWRLRAARAGLAPGTGPAHAGAAGSPGVDAGGRCTPSGHPAAGGTGTLGGECAVADGGGAGAGPPCGGRRATAGRRHRPWPGGGRMSAGTGHRAAHRRRAGRMGGTGQRHQQLGPGAGRGPGRGDGAVRQPGLPGAGAGPQPRGRARGRRGAMGRTPAPRRRRRPRRQPA